MVEFMPDELTERENYKLMVGSVIPRPIALITTMDENGVVNIAPFSYFSIVTSNPPTLSVSFQRRHGRLKDTPSHILSGQEAVIHIVDESILRDANETSANLPRGTSELERTTFHLEPSGHVRVPSLREPKVRFEVVYDQHVEIRKAGEVTADLFLLRIVSYRMDEGILFGTHKIDPERLAPVSRMAGSDYSTLGRTITMKRPEQPEKPAEGEGGSASP